MGEANVSYWDCDTGTGLCERTTRSRSKMGGKSTTSWEA